MATLEETLQQVEKRLEGKNFAGSDGVYQFDIEGAGSYQLVVQDGQAKVISPPTERAGVTIKMNAENFQKMISGEQNPTAMFMAGQLQIEGDMMMAMKLQSLLA
ncbi:MAG: SCP2 sterol-binding domain-containing protein [Firmicutes bacterium]|nr:SCP2 sterol-binding domain-containing protein [Bacillota bacterium]